MMHNLELELFVGRRGTVTPSEDDAFAHEFEGVCVGSRGCWLQVRDQDDNVFEVGVAQFTPTELY